MLLNGIKIDKLLENLIEQQVVSDLQYLRGEKLKVIDLKIDTRIFKYLKKLGVFTSFLQDSNNWQFFNLTERMLLRIAEIFWRYGFSPEIIKGVVDLLISDNWVKPFIENKLINGTKRAISKIVNNEESHSFLEYAVLERKRKPNLKAFTNLEGLLISAIAVDNSISILINCNGDWKLINKQSKLEDGDSFVCVSITSIVKSYIGNDSVFLDPNKATNRNIDSLIRAGVDYKTFLDLEFDGTNTETVLNKLPTTANIGKVKTQFSNQDIVLKVRDSKTVSILQLVINKQK